MTTYHPKYGALLNSREVSDMTGFTMNQLRYFRQVPEKSPFPLLKKGATTLYREQDIEKYLEVHGAIGEEYIVPENFDPAPLVNPEFEAKSNKDFAAIAKITSYNSFSLEEKLIHAGWQSYNEGANFIATEGYRLYGLATGEDLSQHFAPDSAGYNQARKSAPHLFWPIQVYGTRAGARKVQNLDVSDQDIINAPVGEVPPTKQGS